MPHKTEYQKCLEGVRKTWGKLPSKKEERLVNECVKGIKKVKRKDAPGAVFE